MSETNGAATSAAAVVAAADGPTRFTKGVFMRAGLPDTQAGIVAEVLISANRRGVDSYGVARIPR